MNISHESLVRSTNLASFISNLWPSFQWKGSYIESEWDGNTYGKSAWVLQIFYGGSCPFWSKDLNMRDQSLSLSGSRGSRHIKDNRGKVLSQRVWDFRRNQRRSSRHQSRSPQGREEGTTQTNPCISFSLHLIFPSSLVYCSCESGLDSNTLHVWAREAGSAQTSTLIQIFWSSVLREHENSQPGSSCHCS